MNQLLKFCLFVIESPLLFLYIVLMVIYTIKWNSEGVVVLLKVQKGLCESVELQIRLKEP